MTEKLAMMNFAKARTLMGEKAIDVLILNFPKHVYYASNFNSFDCLIASDSQTFAIIPLREDQERYLVASHLLRIISAIWLLSMSPPCGYSFIISRLFYFQFSKHRKGPFLGYY
jgi:Xaa-Pro aminopeptidase